VKNHVGSIWIILDFIFGCGIYHAIDAGTGAWYEFDKKEFEGKLIIE
jgi:hypothetical protein